jgi:hypothetical protein
MIPPRARTRTVRIVIETTVPADVSEGDVLAAIPQPRWLRIDDGDRHVRMTLRYRRWSAVIAPIAGVEAAIKALERAGIAFCITGTLRGAINQLKGA